MGLRGEERRGEERGGEEGGGIEGVLAMDGTIEYMERIEKLKRDREATSY